VLPPVDPAEPLLLPDEPPLEDVLPLLPVLPELELVLPLLPELPEDELGLGMELEGMLLELDELCCSRQPVSANETNTATAAPWRATREGLVMAKVQLKRRVQAEPRRPSRKPCRKPEAHCTSYRN
jgi:hypothetical protein